jgi:putative mRNA 3-end processing factor
MAANDLLQFSASGIYCPIGDFYIDPTKRVSKAVITHAHSDHARRGMGHYLAHKDSIPIMKLRLGKKISFQAVEYGEKIEINGVSVSFHPAGHIIGSAQIRVEYKGEVWVASGDYKVEDDGLTVPFEAIKCHAFITETTFALPVFRWQPQAEVVQEINDWWAANAAIGRTSFLSAYALGKAQRLLHIVNHDIGPVYTHSSVAVVNAAFRERGIKLKTDIPITDSVSKEDLAKALVIAPGTTGNLAHLPKLGNYSLGMASGWMMLRSMRKGRGADRAFILSDHADWDGLNQAIQATEAERVFLTHGYTRQYAQWLNSQGIEAIEGDST